MSDGIFISYRRDDSGHASGRIYDHLATEFGDDRVFFDLDSIFAGEDYEEVIERTLDGCAIVLVVMGPRWATIEDARGRPRISIDGDLHALEVSKALESGLPVLPVLLEGARMPETDELPEHLGRLTRRHAFPLTMTAFRHEIHALVDRMRPVVGGEPSAPPTPPETAKDSPPPETTPAPAQEPALDAPTRIHVAPSGGDYTSIAAAVEAAPPRASIRVAPGRYMDPVLVDKPLELVGDGDPAEIILDVVDTAIQTTADGVRLANLTVIGRDAAEPAAVWVTGGALVIDECDLSAPNGTEGSWGIEVAGGARLTARRCSIHDCRQGVAVEQAAEGAIESCQVRAAAIGVNFRGGGTLRDSDVTSGDVAVNISSETDVVVGECALAGDTHGISVTDNAGAVVVTGCTLSGFSDGGVYVEKSENVGIRDSTIADGGGIGVWVYAGKALVEGGTLRTLGEHGVLVSEGFLGLRDTTIQDVTMCAAKVQASGALFLERCEISGVGTGIVVLQEGGVEAHDTNISDTGGWGVLAQSGQLTLKGCTISNNGTTWSEDGRGEDWTGDDGSVVMNLALAAVGYLEGSPLAFEDVVLNGIPMTVE